MKIRTDFVTNSSSTSYIINKDINVSEMLKIIKDIASYLLTLPENVNKLKGNELEKYVIEIYNKFDMQSYVDRALNSDKEYAKIIDDIEIGLSWLSDYQVDNLKNIVKTKSDEELLNVLDEMYICVFKAIDNSEHSSEYYEVIDWYQYGKEEDFKEKIKNDIIIYGDSASLPAYLLNVILSTMSRCSCHHMG